MHFPFMYLNVPALVNTMIQNYSSTENLYCIVPRVRSPKQQVCWLLRLQCAQLVSTKTPIISIEKVILWIILLSTDHFVPEENSYYTHHMLKGIQTWKIFNVLINSCS